MTAIQLFMNPIDSSVKNVYAVIDGKKFSRKPKTVFQAKIFLLFLPDEITGKLHKLDASSITVKAMNNIVEFTVKDEDITLGLVLWIKKRISFKWDSFFI